MMLITGLRLVVRKTDAVRFDKKLTRVIYLLQLRPLFMAKINVRAYEVDQSIVKYGSNYSPFHMHITSKRKDFVGSEQENDQIEYHCVNNSGCQDGHICACYEATIARSVGCIHVSTYEDLRKSYNKIRQEY